MGLDAIVGLFIELDPDDNGRQQLRDECRRVQAAIQNAGLPDWAEPEDIPFGKSWSARIGSYGALHELRRVAAYLWAGMPVPDPIERATQDPVLRECYAREPGAGRSLWKSLRGIPQFPGNDFAHLIDHGDAEGYYVPLDFPAPLQPDPELKIPGVLIGSSVRLLDECTRLAIALGIPKDLDPNFDSLEKLLDSPPTHGDMWQRHCVASYVCLQLMHGARRSMELRAAIVFC